MHTIVHEVTIAVPPERVFDTLTTTEGLGAWWSSRVEGSLVEGGEIRSVDGFDLRLRVDTLEAPELAHFRVLEGPEEWEGTEIALRVEPTADGTGSVVRFWHGGFEYEDGVLPSVSFAWALRLEALRRTLERS